MGPGLSLLLEIRRKEDCRIRTTQNTYASYMLWIQALKKYPSAKLDSGASLAKIRQMTRRCCYLFKTDPLYCVVILKHMLMKAAPMAEKSVVSRHPQHRCNVLARGTTCYNYRPRRDSKIGIGQKSGE